MSSPALWRIINERGRPVDFRYPLGFGKESKANFYSPLGRSHNHNFLYASCGLSSLSLFRPRIPTSRLFFVFGQFSPISGPIPFLTHRTFRVWFFKKCSVTARCNRRDHLVRHYFLPLPYVNVFCLRRIRRQTLRGRVGKVARPEAAALGSYYYGLGRGAGRPSPPPAPFPALLGTR